MVNHPTETSDESVVLHIFLRDVSLWTRTNVIQDFHPWHCAFAPIVHTLISSPELTCSQLQTSRRDTLLLELSTLSIDPGKSSVRLPIHISIYIPFLHHSPALKIQYFHPQHRIAAQLRARFPGPAPQNTIYMTRAPSESKS